MEKEKISFKPLHEGMGFHPFSDGLPYAPESKAKYQNGTGANVAGRPQFVTSTHSLPVQPKNTVRTARQLQEQQSHEQKPAISQAIPLAKSQIHSARAQTGPLAAQALAGFAQAKVSAPALISEPALLRRRVFAYLMDTVVHLGFWLMTNLVALFLFKFQFDSEILRENFESFILLFLASQWIFIALQEVLFENSIGKVFFNLEFKRNHKSLFIRSLVFMVGILAFGTGLYFRPQDRLGEIQMKSKHTSV